MSEPKVVRSGEEKTTIRVVGDEYSYLATGDETNDAYFVMHALVSPGVGPPPHIQTREEEGFFVLEGQVTFWVDGQRVDADTGTFLHAPRGVVHNFKNETEQDARMLIWFAPAGIEKMFDQLAAEPDRFREIGAAHGVKYVTDP